jgi:uncharacterized protein YegL/Flp pilus assembly protein TadG
MRIFKKFKNDTSGGVFIITAVAAGVMVSLAGMSVDLGMTIIERDRAQNAIDAGVVSGAIRASLGAPEAEVKDAAENYFKMNLSDSRLVSDKSGWDIDPKTGKVSRKLAGDFNTFFHAGSRSTLSVAVEAAATPSLMKASLPPELLNPPKPVLGDIILVLDNSGSMAGSAISDLREAANEFIDEAFSAQNTIAGIHRVGIVGFSDKITLNQDLTDDYGSAKGAASKLKADGGTSPVGLKEASNMLDKSPNDGRQRLVLLMTDGAFNDGGGQERAISECNKLKGNAIIQTVFFQTDESDSSDMSAIRACSSGEFSFATSKDELSSAFKKALKKKDTPPEPEVAPEPVIGQIRLTQ